MSLHRTHSSHRATGPIQAPTALLLGAALVVVTLLPTATRAQPDGDAPPEPAAVRALVHGYLAAWNEDDPAALEELVAVDFQRSDWNGHVRSRAELAARIAEAHETIADLRFELHDLVVDGDRAAARLTLHGTWRDTGDVLAVPIHSLYGVEGGRLAGEFPLGDHLAFREQLGYRVTRPGETGVAPPLDEPPPQRPDFEAMAARTADAAAELSRSAPPKAGTLRVTSRALGRLLLDGRELGVMTPEQTVELRLPRGTHLVVLESLAGRRLADERLELGRGDERELAMGPEGRLWIDLPNRVSEDLRSGLEWTLTDNGEDLDHAEAVAYCEELELAGRRDWRLPDIRELLPLYDPDSKKDWKTVPGIELTSCCPWSANVHGDGMAWNFVSYKGTRGLQHHRFRRYFRALCVREAWSGTPPGSG